MTEEVYCSDAYHQLRDCCSWMTSKLLYSHSSTSEWWLYGKLRFCLNPMNPPAYVKPSETTVWLTVLLKGKSKQSCWTSKVKGLAKWCKYTWVLMILLLLPRRKGQYWQQLKGAQSWFGDGNEEGREGTRCKMSCCGSFTGINNSFDWGPQNKYCYSDLWDTDTLKPC